MGTGLSKGAALIFLGAILSVPAFAADGAGKKAPAAGDLNARMSESLERDIKDCAGECYPDPQTTQDEWIASLGPGKRGAAEWNEILSSRIFELDRNVSLRPVSPDGSCRCVLEADIGSKQVCEVKRLDSKSGAWRVTGVFLSQSGANYDDYHTGWDWESPSVYWFGDHYLVGASGGSVNVYDIATGHLHELCGSDFRTFYRLESAGADFVKVVRASWRKPAAEGTAPDSLWEITISSKPDGILDAVCDEKAKGNRGVNLGKKKPARKAELPAGGTSVSKAGNPPAQETSGDGKKPAQPASAESRDKNPDALPSGAEGIKAVTESPAPGEKAAPADSAKAAGGAENNDSQKESSN
jgi:hypothetical protein